MNQLPAPAVAVLTRLHLLVSGSLLAAAAASVLLPCIESQRQRGSAFPVVLPTREEFQPYPVPKPGEGGDPDAHPDSVFCQIISQDESARARRREGETAWALVAVLLLLGMGIPAHHLRLRRARRRLLARLDLRQDDPPAPFSARMLRRHHGQVP